MHRVSKCFTERNDTLQKKRDRSKKGSKALAGGTSCREEDSRSDAGKSAVVLDEWGGELSETVHEAGFKKTKGQF